MIDFTRFKFHMEHIRAQNLQHQATLEEIEQYRCTLAQSHVDSIDRDREATKALSKRKLKEQRASEVQVKDDGSAEEFHQLQSSSSDAHKSPYSSVEEGEEEKEKKDDEGGQTAFETSMETLDVKGGTNKAFSWLSTSNRPLTSEQKGKKPVGFGSESSAGPKAQASGRPLKSILKYVSKQSASLSLTTENPLLQEASTSQVGAGKSRTKVSETTNSWQFGKSYDDYRPQRSSHSRFDVEEQQSEYFYATKESVNPFQYPNQTHRSAEPRRIPIKGPSEIFATEVQASKDVQARDHRGSTKPTPISSLANSR